MMTDLARVVLAWLLTYAVHSTVLLVVIAVVTRYWLRGDAWRDALWKAGIAGGVITATLSLVLPVAPLTGRWDVFARDAAQDQARGLPAMTDVEEAGVVSRDVEDVSKFGPAFGPPLKSAPTTVVNRMVRVEPLVLVVFAWLSIALLLLARVAWHHVRLFRALRDRETVRDAQAVTVLEMLRRQSGVWRPVRLSVARCPGPLALGASEICVPSRFLKQLDMDAQRSALAHELAHLARRDPAWHLAAGVIESVFFFQPLNRLARIQLREAAEHLADDWAVRYTGSPLALARCLSEVAGWVDRRAVAIPSGTMAMAEGGSPLVRRVERLLAYDGTGAEPALALRIGVALLLLAMSAFAAPAVSAGSTVGPAPETPAVSAVETDSDAYAEIPDATPPAPATDEQLVDPEVDKLVAIVEDRTVPQQERIDAIEALADQYSRASVDALHGIAWRGPNVRFQRTAAESLGAIRNTQTVVVLNKIIDLHPSTEVQVQAVESLAALRGPGAAQRLLELARSHTKAPVRREALDQLSDVVGSHDDLTVAQAETLVARVVADGADVDIDFDNDVDRAAGARVCETDTRRIDVRTGEWLSIRTNVGSVRFEGWDRSYAEVQSSECAYSVARLADARVTITQSDGGYRIESEFAAGVDRSWNIDNPKSPRNPPTFDYVVRVPRWIRLRELDVPGGPLTIANIDGDVHGSAASGPVTARNLRGAINLSSESGAVDVTLTESPRGSVQLASKLGEVNLQVAAGVNASVTLEAEHGQTRSDVPLVRNRALLGGGGAPVLLKTVYGRVELNVQERDEVPQQYEDDSHRFEKIALSAGERRQARDNARSFADLDYVRMLVDLSRQEPKHELDLVSERATWALAQMRGSNLAGPLEDALGDTRWQVRAYAAWSIGAAGQSTVYDKLLASLNDPHWRVRVNAAYSLQGWRDPRVITPLARMLDAPQWQVRIAAVESLAATNNPLALPALRKATQDGHLMIRETAQLEVRRLGG